MNHLNHILHKTVVVNIPVSFTRFWFYWLGHWLWKFFFCYRFSFAFGAEHIKYQVFMYRSMVQQCKLIRLGPLNSCCLPLTHWGRDKMAANFLTFSNAFLWRKIYKFRLRFHWSLFPIDNNPALVLTKAWHWIGDKPLSETMMVSLLTYMCHSASMS